MKRILLFTLILFLATSSFAEEVKKADLAGTWYPSSDKQLSAMFDSYMKDVIIKDIPSDIIAVIVPHAGYMYSGPIAAYSFKAIADMDIDTIVIVGFSHRRYYDAISVYDRGVFETPFGVLPVDKELAKKLMVSHDKFYFNPKAFDNENSVEMLLPFIRYTFRDEEIKIVPIAMGVQSYENCAILSDALVELLKDRDNVLIMASTDMSHYHNYGEANAIDGLAVKTLESFDEKSFFDKISFKKCEACGAGPIVATMMAARGLGADTVKVLKYGNSGDTTGEKNKVVGYISAALYNSGEKEREESGQSEKETGMLSNDQKKRLLEIARETMETYVKTKKRLDFNESDPLFNKEMGAFVTLHKKGQLRGCIGNIIGRGPLYLTVRNMAIESSTGDPRFPNVTAAELDDIDVEVSVLSEPEKITDPEDIVMGKHGVIVKSGFRSGVYLPQVATETGWTRDQFMSSLCTQKAGLPADAWKTGEVEIFVFTAEVFSEKDLED